MFGKKISLVYFYVISAASLALIVIGVFSISNLIINFTQYDKYPLRYQGEDCEFYPYYGRPMAAPIDAKLESSPSAQELENQKRICMANQERMRKQQMLEDIRNAILFTGIGTILFGLHFTQARKLSKE